MATSESPLDTRLDAEDATRQRYSAAAQAREAALCCPVEYDQTLLEAIPAEVIARDYGCGDSSRYVRPGETVLDLGSGGGKICFIASQVVGAHGRVIGIEPASPILEAEQRVFDCSRTEPRHPRETKGADYRLNKPATESCC